MQEFFFKLVGAKKEKRIFYSRQCMAFKHLCNGMVVQTGPLAHLSLFSLLDSSCTLIWNSVCIP